MDDEGRLRKGGASIKKESESKEEARKLKSRIKLLRRR